MTSRLIRLLRVKWRRPELRFLRGGETWVMYPVPGVCSVEDYLPGNQLNIHTMSRTSRTHDTPLASFRSTPKYRVDFAETARSKIRAFLHTFTASDFTPLIEAIL